MLLAVLVFYQGGFFVLKKAGLLRRLIGVIGIGHFVSYIF